MSQTIFDTLSPLLRQAHDHALDYLEGLEERPVSPRVEDVRALDAFDEPMPDVGTDAQEMLDLLHSVGSKATCAQIVGRYFGFVNGGAHPPAIAAKWLADVWDQNGAFQVMSPVCSRLEILCERWLTELLGLPNGTAMGLVTGTSTAITCSLAAARNELLRKQGWDVASNGLFGAPPLQVVLGEEAHAAVFRSLSLLGLGRDRVEVVPVDDQGRMLASELPSLDESTLVVTQAGNVNSGAFDPVDEVVEAARAVGAWVHVDGAFGLWALASPKYRPLARGAELADSWSVDAHKTLNAPYDCGVVLCRNAEALLSAMHTQASYLIRSADRDGSMFTPDMSRRARAVELWATLKTMGREGVAELVEGLCERASQCADLLKREGFSVPNDVVFNQVLVSCDTVEERDAIVRALSDSGECWCGGAEWKGRPVIRISVCSARTTSADIERTVRAFTAAREAVS